MVAQQYECTYNYVIVPLKTVKIVIIMLCMFYHNYKKEMNEEV